MSYIVFPKKTLSKSSILFLRIYLPPYSYGAVLLSNGPSETFYIQTQIYRLNLYMYNFHK